MRSGELAAAAGVNVETLRYYERRGLLPEPQRSLGGHREYDDGAVALLRVVKATQRLGFTLDEVAKLLDTGRRRRHPTPDLQARAQEKIAEVEGRIADLRRIGDELRRVVAARCDSLAHCSCQDCPLPFVELAAVETRSGPAPAEQGGRGASGRGVRGLLRAAVARHRGPADRGRRGGGPQQSARRIGTARAGGRGVLAGRPPPIPPDSGTLVR